MALINNIVAYHKAIAAVCPIHGVDATGFIDFAPEATDAQKAAAQAVAAKYADLPDPNAPPPAPQLQRPLDAEGR